MGEPRVIIVSRHGCHLCEVAAQTMTGIADRTGVTWTEVFLDGDEKLEREYGDRVPVILLDGKEHGYWRVEEARLLRDLGL